MGKNISKIIEYISIVIENEIGNINKHVISGCLFIAFVKLIIIKFQFYNIMVSSSVPFIDFDKMAFKKS